MFKCLKHFFHYQTYTYTYIYIILLAILVTYKTLFYLKIETLYFSVMYKNCLNRLDLNSFHLLGFSNAEQSAFSQTDLYKSLTKSFLIF